ncbi:phosphomevalonate kinase [Mycena floridula]|nr:phosphomevalonate kinase [Mycena floridula]
MSTVVSAPGKVLIAGGYLVLDPSYSGIVVSTSSRFYTVVQAAAATNRIQVRSPQFLDATWDYSIHFQPQVVMEAAPENTSKNKFVHLALQSTIALACEIKGVDAIQNVLENGLNIVIVGDNDFYSQRATLASREYPRTLESLARLTPFISNGVRLSEVHKTGLGSSAALITSLVSGLLLHLSAISTKSLTDIRSPERHLAHNLAQYVHCLAQGKIGSGFDVAAAVFGSQVYTRFDPAVLQDLMNDNQPLLPVLTPSKAWNYRNEPFQLPPLTRIMLADVDAGSDTPSLVGKVLKWRKDRNEHANALWTSLDQLNQSLAQTLLHIGQLHANDPENYASAVKYISSLQPVQWTANPFIPDEEHPIVTAFYNVHEISESIRAKMREMGNSAGVPIEPDEQKKLLDACVSQAGVIGGGVPGAGGYDAIWLLVFDPVDCTPDQRPSERIEHVWTNYKNLDVSPLSCVESTEKGLRLEKLDEIKGLEQVITH